ncbi:MAG: alpha/beta hydrolase [Balneolaceae bacterium]
MSPPADTLYYKTYSSHPDKDWVVFVHGAGGSSTIWFRQLKEFREAFNVLFVDLRGHGQSTHSFERHFRNPYTLEGVTQDLIDVLDKLEIHRAHFIGVSLGTLLIRTLEEMQPSRVYSVVQCGAIMRLNIRSRFLIWGGHLIKRWVPFIWLYRLFSWIILPRANHQESRHHFIREARKMAKKEFLRWFRLSYEMIPVMRVFRQNESPNPTLYVMGREDHMFLPAIQTMVNHHHNSELHVIEECGHVCNIERPDEFNRVAIAFLSKHASTSHNALTD